MAKQFLDITGLSYYDQKIKGVAVGSLTIAGQTVTFKAIDGSVIGTFVIPEKVYNLATETENGLLSAEGFKKLAAIAEGATKVEKSDVNGNILVNGIETKVYTHTTGAEAATAGLYVITTDAEGHVKTVRAATKADITGLGIPGQDTTYEDATQAVHGLMSTDDKIKLDGVTAGATKVANSSTNGNIQINDLEVQVYKHATHTAYASGLYKVTVDEEGHVTAVVAVTKADLVELGLPAQDTTYGLATGETDGLMSAADFSKLQGIADGAQVNVLEGVNVNGEALPINGKKVNIDLSDYAKKSDITAVYKYKGSVATYAELPASPTTGDVYNVEAADEAAGILAGDNVAWNGEAWDRLAGNFVMEAIPNSEIDKLFAAA